MRQIEILAPVGDPQMLSAAVFSGADAVYLGLTIFNARRSAGNFTPEALSEAVCFCHARGVRVHVTLNTTLYSSELPAMAECIRQVAEAGADAVIVQDLATAALVKKIAPSLPMHASTQMSIHTLAGARQAAALGFRRVILARELSMDEIRTITEGCGIETEVFVHGALCMSMSGQCTMSAFLGGRSGNRGSCAGTCRLPFDARSLPAGKPGVLHHLSLKDQSLIDRLPQLQAMGVASVKIEGRLRPPEYVAAAVNACVLSRDSQPYDPKLLQDVFSRSGFTSGYLDGKIDKSMFGTRTEADAASTKAVLPKMRELYRRERPRIPIHFAVDFAPEGVKLTAADPDGNRGIAYSQVPPQPAQKDPAEGIRKALSKTGGTPFLCGEIELHGEPGFLPGSEWNELRRTVLEKLLSLREQPHPLPVQAVILPEYPRRTVGKQAMAARFASWEQVPPEAEHLTYLLIPIGEATHVPQKERKRVILELPRAMFGGLEGVVAKQIELTKEQGFLGYEVNNLAHFELCRGLPIFGGMGLNITNPLAASAVARLGCKSITALPEVTLEEMETMGVGVPLSALVYGHIPVMLTRACPLKNVTDCSRCNKQGLLTDRKARKFPVRCSLGMRTIYNPVPVYVGEKPVPADVRLAYFTIESKERCAEVLNLLFARAPFDGEFTRGLYYKGTN